MRVKAIARGFDGQLRNPGDVFEVADTMPGKTVDEKGLPLKEPMPDVPHTALWFVPVGADEEAGSGETEGEGDEETARAPKKGRKKAS